AEDFLAGLEDLATFFTADLTADLTPVVAFLAGPDLVPERLVAVLVAAAFVVLAAGDFLAAVVLAVVVFFAGDFFAALDLTVVVFFAGDFFAAVDFAVRPGAVMGRAFLRATSAQSR
ncbi:MAG: hypothetical protein ABJA87_13460, partial [bacterium]